MHSGINTYIPRGLGSLEKRISHHDYLYINLEKGFKNFVWNKNENSGTYIKL
jgi:hypothetical protein